MNLDALQRADELDGLSEFELLDLYRRVRTMLAKRLGGADGSESLEMLFARLAEVVEPRPVPTVRISPREKEVLHFLAQSKTNAEIAAALFISENTVKNHLTNIYDKYGTRSRQSVVLAAIKEGVVEIV